MTAYPKLSESKLDPRSPQEFLLWEERQSQKYEYKYGEVIITNLLWRSVMLVGVNWLDNLNISAIKNTLAAGLAVSVCGATIRPEQSKSVKAGAKSPLGKKQKPKL